MSKRPPSFTTPRRYRGHLWWRCPTHPEVKVTHGWDCGKCMDIALGQEQI